MDDLISRQQAIDAIMGEYPDAHYPDWYASKIRALPSAQSEERTEKRTETHACDLISRQAAVELAMNYCPDDDGSVQCDGDIRGLLDELENLPSAQPEPCEDAVSRHRLLSDLEELIAAWKKYPVMAEQIKGVEAAIGYVEAIPSAQPERKNGKWNTYYHSDIDFSHSCNQCGYSAPYQMIGGEVFQKKWNFCPNCGADMRGEKDD